MEEGCVDAWIQCAFFGQVIKRRCSSLSPPCIKWDLASKKSNDLFLTLIWSQGRVLRSMHVVNRPVHDSITSYGKPKYFYNYLQV